MGAKTRFTARFLINGLALVTFASCIAAQGVAFNDCMERECVNNTATDTGGQVRDLCCRYLEINSQRCCSRDENSNRLLYFNLAVGLSVAVGVLIIIIFVIVCISVCCCCC